MNMLTQEWLQASQDDLDVIEEILEKDHLTHIVAFHAQQCVEKAFKAILEETGRELPKIHNLVTLYGLIEDLFGSESLEDTGLTMLKQLDELYIDARYPGALGLLPNGKPTVEDARTFYQFAQKMSTLVLTVLEQQGR